MTREITFISKIPKERMEYGMIGTSKSHNDLPIRLLSQERRRCLVVVVFALLVACVLGGWFITL